MLFEETYRENTHKSEQLTIKNYIGGKFSLASSNQDCITVTNFPELHRMTSRVFGGIAARNFGYAKVEVKKA